MPVEPVGSSRPGRIYLLGVQRAAATCFPTLERCLGVIFIIRRAAFDAFALDPAFQLAEALLTTAGSEDEHTRDTIRLGALALFNLAPLAKEPWIS